MYAKTCHSDIESAGVVCVMVLLLYLYGFWVSSSIEVFCLETISWMLSLLYIISITTECFQVWLKAGLNCDNPDSMSWNISQFDTLMLRLDISVTFLPGNIKVEGGILMQLSCKKCIRLIVRKDVSVNSWYFPVKSDTRIICVFLW